MSDQQVKVRRTTGAEGHAPIVTRPDLSHLIEIMDHLLIPRAVAT